MIKLFFVTMMMGVAAMESPSGTAQPFTTSPGPAGQSQPIVSMTATSSHRPQIKCVDYRRQPDGAWTPRRPVGFGGVSLTPGTSFTPGVAFSGIDLAAILDARCSRTPGR